MNVPKKYKPEEIEDRYKSEWVEKGLYSWDPSRGRDETFVVDTPPPTVSGSLHVGHLFSYSHQDFIVRYQRMQGKNIFFPIGWDDNGLPTERRVQNLLNVRCEAHLPYDPDFQPDRSGKKKGDPTPISRKNFVELCDEVVVEDEKAFKNLWTRLGMSYDWEQEYATINEHCRRISQHSFIELHEKNEVYHDERPVMWDVDFQTAVAQAELDDREVPSAYHHLSFGVENSDARLVVATTRPELLPACVAVVVHPDDARYREFVGKNAVTPLFHVPVPIIADAKADPEKGTGVVMVCTFGDQTDVEWWRENNLPTRQIINKKGHLSSARFIRKLSDGRFEFAFGGELKVGGFDTSTSSLTRFLFDDHSPAFSASKSTPWIESRDPLAAETVYSKMYDNYVKKARRILVEEAEAAGAIADPPKEITHSVKFYEKGERPLELIPTRQWYTKIMDKKDALLAQGRKIEWHPPFMCKRYEHWVEGLNQDWCLSRQRYFGVPIPVWYPIDEAGHVVYDKPILPAKDALPVDPLAEAPAGYTEDQRNQPGGFSGDPDVFDTWATSSLTPQIASHWSQDAARHAKLFPMDMRPQAHEIIRTWAFYTIVKAYLHEGEVPWRNIVLSGWILDPDRKKMSKSTGNVVTPEPLIDEFGADAVRYWPARARLGVDTAFDAQMFKVGKRLCMKLFNASKFVMERFADVDTSKLAPEAIVCESDRAAIGQLRPVIARATKAFDAFDYAQALQVTEEFFWGTFCDNFIELAKPRTYDEELTPERVSAAAALRLTLRATLRLFAPFMPFITEEVWQWAFAGDADMHSSIHRSPWPMLEEFAAVPEPKSAELWPLMVQVLDEVRKAKAEANLSIKAPVARVTVTGAPEACAAIQPSSDDITRMLSIEDWSLQESAGADALVVDIELAQA